MVPDFVNKFTSKSENTEEEIKQAPEDADAKKAAQKEMEDILKDSVNE